MFFQYPHRSLTLLTDLYELTMAYGYWKHKMVEHEAIFHLFYRRPPFQGGYAVAAGLASVIEYVRNWTFDASDLAYLATLRNPEGSLLFEEAFLRYLEGIQLSCDIDAMVEGEIVFPLEPLVRVRGPLVQAQILETALLTLINFPTLIATKASRMCYAAGQDPVIEFGLRRAQGIDGGMTASRAAFLGGCESTSNTLAGKWLGIPVRGTHAHSWVMAFDSELESFLAYADAMPHNCIFLVDTYDTLQGVKHAIEVGHQLRERGYPLLGVRLDSGDLTTLSRQARQMLDQAGFEETKIYATNELSEELIVQMKQQGAAVTVWGVGTHLVTGQTQPALDGVYKLAAIRAPGEQEWKYKLKFSEKLSKVSDPGSLQVRRFHTPDRGYVADAIYDALMLPPQQWVIIDAHHGERHIATTWGARDLLIPIFSQGQQVYTPPPLTQSRSECLAHLQRFAPTLRTLSAPQPYLVGMERELYRRKQHVMQNIRETL